MTQQQQQNAISNSIPPPNSIQQSVPNQHLPLPLNLNVSRPVLESQAHHSPTNSPHSLRRDPPPALTTHHNAQQQQHTPMDMDDDEDEDIEVNVHDEDSPLDMRIATKQESDDSVRPSVIRRAPSFKETSNSPFDSSQSGTAGEFSSDTVIDYGSVIGVQTQGHPLGVSKNCELSRFFMLPFLLLKFTQIPSPKMHN